MPRKSRTPITRHNIRLREGDLNALGAAYPRLGASVALRDLVARHVDDLRRRSGARPSDIEVDLKEPTA